jgi:SAM-dependent methyltransferase
MQQHESVRTSAIALFAFLTMMSSAAQANGCSDDLTTGGETVKYENPHAILDGDASLLRHHLAKEQLRNHQLDLIPLASHAHVLDIGIGPGLYLKHWLKITREKQTTFDLFDSSASSLKKCGMIAGEIGDEQRIRTIEGDMFGGFENLEKESYDAIFIGNTIEYVPNPADYIRSQLLPLLKPGGILAIRDLDCSFMSCNLVPRALNARVVYSRIQNNAANSRKDPNNYQNPFIGRDLQNIMADSGLSVIAVHPFFVEFKGPIKGPQRAYLEVLHQNWYVEDTQSILSAEDKAAWQRAFDPTKEGNVLDNPNTIYVEAEFLVIGRKPGP